MLVTYLKENKIYVLLAAMILLSVFAVTTYGQYTYYGAMALIMIQSIRKKDSIESLFPVLLLWLLVCSLVNGVFDWRYFAFILVLGCSSPMFSSYEGYLYRSKVLFAICMVLPIVTILNLYAYHAGINYFILINYNVSDLNFSGFLFHPMWLSAINGASNVSLLYLFYKMKGSQWFIKYGILLLLLASIYLSVVAASRSALAASLIAMASMVYFYSNTGGKFIRNGVIVAILVSLLLPYYQSGGEQMQNKMDDVETGGNSRRDKWNARIDEFESSPLFGIGFATAHDEWGNLMTGTVETGSGWLTILSQSGLIGAFIMFLILRRVYVPIEEIREKRGLLVIFGCELIYLFMHSCFEGYIYTAGYCPCLFFWLVVGFFYEYNKYGLPIETVEEDEEDEDEVEEDEELYEEVDADFLPS
ncbi:MAG: O-antigen ligase family protein [Bacteroidaceae bacterium]|nr:O-antigen ligase family protein [Bacteroidaceae bacterium]